MGSYLRIVLLPLIVLLATAAIIVGIGSILLALSDGGHDKYTPVYAALGMSVLVMAIATFLGTRTRES